MRTPMHAMLWELWRTSWRELLLRIVSSSALICWLCTFTVDFSQAEGFVARSAVLVMLIFGSVFSMTWAHQLDNKSPGFCFRLGFARPISTTQLVMVPLLFTVVSGLLCFLVPALVFVVFQDATLPLLPIGAVVACLVTCVVAATWIPTTIFGRWSGLIGVASGFLVAAFLFHSRKGDPDPWFLAVGKPGYFDFDWSHYALCLTLAGLGVVATIVGVEQQRHGDRVSRLLWTGLLTRRRPRTQISRPRAGSTREATPVEPCDRGRGMVARPSHDEGRSRNIEFPKPFAGPFAAQCWFEMRRGGLPVLLFGLLAPLLPLTFLSFVYLVENPSWQGPPYMWLAVLGLCVVVYPIIGVEAALGLRRRQGATQLSAFDATRSLRNDHLIAAKLVVIAACSLTGWLCMAAVVLLHSFIADHWTVWAGIVEPLVGAAGDVPLYWWAAACAGVVLLYASNTSILLAFCYWMQLYGNWAMCLPGLMFAHVIVAVWDAKHDWAYRHLWAAYGYVVSVTIVVGCVLVLKKALASGYLGSRLFGAAVVLWSVYAASMIALYAKAAPAVLIHPAFLAVGTSMLLVPLAATAIAPLALATHRHA